MLLFGERLTTMQAIGGALVIGAVILAETGRGEPRTSETDTVVVTVSDSDVPDHEMPAVTPR